MDPTSPEAMSKALMGPPYLSDQPEGEWNPQPTPKQGPALGYMGDYLKSLWGPSWADKANAYDQKAWEGYKQGGLKGMLSTAPPDQGLYGGFGPAAVNSLKLVPRINLPEATKDMSLSSLGSNVFRQLVGGTREYGIYDDAGKYKGTMNTLSESPFKDDSYRYDDINDNPSFKKEMHVTGLFGTGPNTLGPREVASLLPQIKREFPDAETISASRVTGARQQAGPYDPFGPYNKNLEASLKVPKSIKPAPVPAGYKPYLNDPLTLSEHDDLANFQHQVGKEFDNYVRDTEGNIHLYDSNFAHMGTVPKRTK